MQIKTSLLSVTIASAVLLMASCSGSSTENENSGGSSSAGKDTGGSSTAGSGNGNGGSNSAGSGDKAGNGNGGSANTGGFDFGGNFGLGGAGFDPADYMCDPKPEAGTACAMGTQPCASGTNVCYCQAEKWACIDLSGLGEGGAGPGGGGFEQVECPATKPTSGAACSGFGACPYGQNQYCACLGTSWMCTQ